MLEKIFNSDFGEISPSNMFVVILSALLLGALIGCVYMYVHRREKYSQTFIVTLAILPAVVAVIIMLVGNNTARAFSLAGSFALIRFRSTPGEPMDIAYVFFCVAAGLGCGIGKVAYAVLFVLVVGIVMLLFNISSFGKSKKTTMTLKVTVPEDLNYVGLLDDILDKYTSEWHPVRVRSTSFGSLFELCYRIELNKISENKALIDAIRQRNGNLNVSLTLFEQSDFAKYLDKTAGQ